MSATTSDIKKLIDELGLDSGLNELEYGNALDNMILTFKLPNTSVNRDLLVERIGSRYTTLTEVKIFNGDDLNPDASYVEHEHYKDVTYYDPELPGDVTESMFVGYEFLTFNRASLLKLSNEQLIGLIGDLISFHIYQNEPCEWDMLLIFIVVVATMIATAGSSASVANTFMSLAGQLLSFISTTGGFADKSKSFQSGIKIFSVILQLGTGYEAFTSGQASSVGTNLNFGLQVANAVTTTITAIKKTEINKLLENEYKEQKAIQEENEAELFEAKFRYTYEDSYDAVVREGPEADPTIALMQHYKQFSVY